MDHSIYGYLSRRSKDELEQIIAMCEHLQENEYDHQIFVMAKSFLKERTNDMPAVTDFQA